MTDDFLGPSRDTPLCARFSVDPDPEVDDAIGAPEKLQGPCRLIVDSLFRACATDRPNVSYSRHKPYYTSARRVGWPLSYLQITDAVEHLYHQQWIIDHRARAQPPGLSDGMQSWLELTPESLAWLTLRGGVRSPLWCIKGPILRLKHRDTRHFLLFKATDLTRQLQREMAMINESAIAAAWEPAPADIIDRRGDCVAVRASPDGDRTYLNMGGTGYVLLLTADGSLRDWTCGRMYGWPAQTAPRNVRFAGACGGRPVGEVDFSSLNPRLVLLDAGQCPADHVDIYLEIAEVAGANRSLVKRAVNVGLNAATIRQAAAAIARAIARAEGRYEESSDYAQAYRIIRAIEALYPPLGGQIGKDLGVRLMRRESAIVRRAALLLHGCGVPCIIIHDALMAAASDLGRVQEAMAQASWEEVGIALPTRSS